MRIKCEVKNKNLHWILPFICSSKCLWRSIESAWYILHMQFCKNTFTYIFLHMKIYEGTYGNICNCMRIRAIMETHAKKMQIHGNICKYVRIHGNARKCAKTCINICRFILSSLTYACNRGCCCIKSKWHLLCTSQPRWYRHEKLLTDEINQMGCGRIFSSKVLTDEQDWLMSGSNWQLT